MSALLHLQLAARAGSVQYMAKMPYSPVDCVMNNGHLHEIRVGGRKKGIAVQSGDRGGGGGGGGGSGKEADEILQDGL